MPSTNEGHRGEQADAVVSTITHWGLSLFAHWPNSLLQLMFRILPRHRALIFICLRPSQNFDCAEQTISLRVSDRIQTRSTKWIKIASPDRLSRPAAQLRKLPAKQPA